LRTGENLEHDFGPHPQLRVPGHRPSPCRHCPPDARIIRSTPRPTCGYHGSRARARPYARRPAGTPS
jgi:hypothetical protein